MSRGKEIKCEAMQSIYHFFATSLINSITQEHECFILYIIQHKNEFEYFAIHSYKTIIKCHFMTLPKYRPRHEKAWLPGCANNEGTDQPAHSCSLISAFLVIRSFESIVSKL